MLQHQIFSFNPFQENTYLFWDESKHTVIVDPGCYGPAEKEVLKKYILDHQLKPVVVLNTHCHIDHILGNAFVCSEWDVPLFVPAGEKSQLQAVLQYGPGMGIYPELSPEPAGLLKGGDILSYARVEWQVLSVPGHSPDGLCFYLPQENILIAGDVLFAGSIGRTDLPGGNYPQLLSGITEKLLPLPGHTRVYPGHGESTTIADENRHNPFILDWLSR